MQRLFIAAIAALFTVAGEASPIHAAPAGSSPVGHHVKKLTPNLARDLSAGAEQAQTAGQRHRVIVSLTSAARGGFDPLSGSLKDRMSMAAHQSLVAARQAEFENQFKAMASSHLVRRYRTIPAMAMNLTAQEIKQLTASPMVVSIGRMEVYQKYSAESHPLAGVDTAHADGYLGNGVRVAIIDDGFQTSHPAFGGESGFPTSRVVGGFDFGDNDSDPRNDCPGQSHGTSVAGIVAGNGGGVTGVAPNADLVVLKIQSSSICGQSALDGDLVAAIDWVVSNRSALNIGVLSMSLGGGAFSTVSACENDSPALTNVLDAAESAGIVTFAASGNDGLCQQMGQPACIGSVISVGASYDADVGNPGYCVSPNACVATSFNSACAPSGREAAFEGTTFADKVTVYSNSTSFLDILAPSNCAFTASTQSGTTDCFGGTSAATPFAAGTAALVLQAAGGWNTLNQAQTLSVLRDNGDNVTDARMGRTTPRVNASAAVNAVAGTTEVCNDGVDNDGDGAVDCADSDCAGDPACNPTSTCTVDEGFESGSTGWTNSGASTCSTGDFIRGTPTEVVARGVTTQVGGANLGSNALFTATNSSAGVNDVDGGNCILLSPTFSVSDASTLNIAYFHGQRDAGDDANDFFRLEVSTDGGSTFTSIASTGDSTSNAAWNTASTAIAAGSQVQVRVQCSDGAGPGDLVECGIDDLSICSN